MKKATTFVSAGMLLIFGIVAAIIGGAGAREGHSAVGWIFATTSLGALITAGLVMMDHERKARHVAIALFTTATVVVVLVLSMSLDSTENAVKAAIFGFLVWLIGLSVIRGAFFAKEPRPSRYTR